MKAFQVLYVLCFTRPRYQVSVYRTTGPLVQVLYGLCFTRPRYQVSGYRTIGPLVSHCGRLSRAVVIHTLEDSANQKIRYVILLDGFVCIIKELVNREQRVPKSQVHSLS